MGEQTRLSVGDISRLIELVSEMSDRGQCTPSEAIDRITRVVAPETVKNRWQRSEFAALVARLRRLRMRRNELLGAPLFRDPAWDMLLELFVAHERGVELTITSLCYTSGVPLSTGTRQFQRLEEHGLVTRKGDREDTRRFIAKPTAKALTGVATVAGLLLEETAAFATVTTLTESVAQDAADATEEFPRDRRSVA